jgi:hypothetical protein
MSVYVDTEADKRARMDGSASVRWSSGCFFGEHNRCRGKVWRENELTPCECGCHGGLVKPTRPEIVCLCGSTRFYDAFQQANYDLTMAGKIVLTVGFYPHATAESGHGEGVGHDSAQKIALDELHKRKIDLADRVLVLNVEGYIGKSTRDEIDYALAHQKTVELLEPPGRFINPLSNFDDEENDRMPWQQEEP